MTKTKGLNNNTVPLDRKDVEPGFVPFYEFAEGLTAMSNQPPEAKSERQHTNTYRG